MFTGIVEAMGSLVRTEVKGTNVEFWFSCPFTQELKVDQSLAHNGVCLTVVEILGDQYRVTAIDETLKKTNMGNVAIGQKVNLERCMAANARFDGHIVQGHVDQTGVCTAIEDQNGSWLISFEYDATSNNITVEKGSICINGVSLTVVNSKDNGFSVAIIPYTWEHTNFNQLSVGNIINLEFDILGKYIQKILARS
jgi:riboflavin synthase